MKERGKEGGKERQREGGVKEGMEGERSLPLGSESIPQSFGPPSVGCLGPQPQW